MITDGGKLSIRKKRTNLIPASTRLHIMLIA